jgi:hypothetical protein
VPSYPLFLTSFLILSSHIHLDLQSGLFPTGFTCMHLSSSPLSTHTTCLAYDGLDTWG